MDFIRYRINRRVLNDLKKRSTIGIAFYLIISVVVLTTGDYYKQYPEFSLFFFGANTFICLFRLLHVLVSDRRDIFSEKLNNIIFFASVIITAMIWGFGFAWFMNQTEEYEARLLMAICTAGLCAGGVTAFMPERRLAIAFNISILFPAFISMCVLQSNISLAAVIFLYSIYLTLVTIRGNNEYWDALENEYMLKRKSYDLERLSNTDTLTNLYNRRYFNEIYEFEWKRATRNGDSLSIIICDIDHFKNINDTFGHLAGDEYLKTTAEILKSVFKRELDIVARYGGEEFVVLLSGTDADTAFEMAEKARSRLESARVVYKDESVSATISIGIMSCNPSFIDNREAIISKADRALYQAKKDGRNLVRHYSAR